jgi:hypothetical protein
VSIAASAGEALDAKGIARYTDSVLHLSMEDDDDPSLKRKSVAMPDDVRKAVREDDEVKNCVSEPGDTDYGSDPATWFTSIPISLKDGGRPAMLLLPHSLCVMGANIQGFRVFSKIGVVNKRVFLAYATSMDVLRTKSVDGYHDIGIIAGSAAVEWGAIYRFKDGHYLPIRCWQHVFASPREPQTKIETIPCSESTEKPYR